jgi:hypothetical protein
MNARNYTKKVNLAWLNPHRECLMFPIQFLCVLSIFAVMNSFSMLKGIQPDICSTPGLSTQAARGIPHHDDALCRFDRLY